MRRQDVGLGDVVVHRQAELLEVVDALRPPRRLAGRLHGGQQQGDQDGDDRDHHQQLDQRETRTPRSDSTHRTTPWMRMEEKKDQKII